MAKAKLSPDEIDVILKLNATQAQEEYRRLQKENKELEKNANATRKAMATIKATVGENSEAYKKAATELKELTNKIEVNKAKMEEVAKRFDTSTMTVDQLNKRLKQLKREFKETSKATDPKRYQELRKQITETSAALGRANAESRGLREGFYSLSKMKQVVTGFFTGIGMAILNQLVSALKSATNTIMDFERANSKLAAILGTNFEGVSKLTEQAKLLGRTTSATASEVTGLQIELAKLGFTQQEIEALTPATLKFAKAVDTDLASASAFAGATLRMFGKDASEAESLLATFAMATTNSALDFNKLQASMATIGPVANSFGFSVEETTALLGILANAGFDASSAATATRNILLNLCDSSGELAQALGQPVNNLDDLVAGLKKLEAEGVDLAKALELTDKRSVAAFSSFLSGAGDLLELRDAITDCTEDFNSMAATMADNSSGSFKGFQSACEGLILKFFDFREVLKTLFEAGTAVVNWIGELIDSLSGVYSVLKAVIIPIKFIVGIFAVIVGWIAKLITQTKLGRAVLNAVVAGLIAYKVATIAASTATKTFFKNIVASSKALLTYIKNLALQVKGLISQAASTVKAAIAQRSFNAALMANPIMMVVGLIAMLVSAIIGYNSVIDDSTKKTKSLEETINSFNEAMSEADGKYSQEEKRLKDLRAVAMSELETKENRLAAIKKLNAIVPEYNAHLDQETGKYVENKRALDEYLNSLKKKMRIESMKTKYQELIDADAESRSFWYERWKFHDKVADFREVDAVIRPNSVTETAARRGRLTAELPFEDFYELQATDESKALSRFENDFLPSMGLSIDDLTEKTEKLNNTISTSADKTVSRLKEIDTELKKLRKMNPESDEELDRIQKRIKLLQEEKKQLLGNAKTKREVGTYREDSIDRVTAPIDEEHQRQMLEINKQKQYLSDADLTIKKNQEMIRYCSELTTALEGLKSETDATHTQTLDKINKEITAAEAQAVEAQQAIDKANVQRDQETHERRLKNLEDYYEEQRIIMQRAVNNQEVTQEAADVYVMNMERQLHKNQLDELNRYYDEVKKSDLISVDDKKKTLDKLYKEIRTAWNKVITDTGNWQQKLRELVKNEQSLAGIRASIDMEKRGVAELYDTLISELKTAGEDTTALEEAKNRKLKALDYKYLEEQYKIQEMVGLSWADEYDRELAKLQNMHEQGILSEEQFQAAKLQLQIKNAKKYFDFYSGLATSMVSAMQEAEIAQVEAKYDVLIQDAKNNGEETAALEEEKENKKLEIQKKYADVNFAIKISQIIADTAVSIMKAFADLGPIAGAIAAAMLTATGAAQVIQAKAERDKIKNMSPSKTSKSTTPATTVERALTGYSEGGYTGDGGRYEVAGVVHRGEYVVPMPIMNNPRVIDAVGTIEAIRRNKRLTSGSAPMGYQGFADGGFTGSPGATVDLSEILTLIAELKSIISIARSKPLKAYVVYKDITKAGEMLDASQHPFTR